MNLLELHLKTLNLCINIILQLILIINLLKLNLRGLKNNMADVGSVTNFNSSLPNPLATLTSVMGIANTAQQNQLLQTANQQRQLQLQQGFADDLLGSVAPLVNKPGVTQAEVLGTLASRARNFGPNGQPAYDIAAQRYQGPDWQNNLKLDATRATGN